MSLLRVREPSPRPSGRFEFQRRCLAGRSGVEAAMACTLPTAAGSRQPATFHATTLNPRRKGEFPHIERGAKQMMTNPRTIPDKLGFARTGPLISRSTPDFAVSLAGPLT